MLKLPILEAAENIDYLKEENNVLDLALTGFKSFKCDQDQLTSYAQIKEEEILVLSCTSETKMFAELVPISSTLKRIEKPLSFALKNKFP